MPHRILTINPGSTSTKISLFEGEKPVFSVEARHSKEDLAGLPTVWDQLDLRRRVLRAALDQAALDRTLDGPLQAVVGRGGLLAPLPGGVYAINQRMLEDLRSRRFGEHPCNLGAPLALETARQYGVPAFVVDPVVTDELRPEARLTGLPHIQRRSTFHALSQRGAARETARRLGIGYEQGKFVVAHLGGGVSIGAHLRGRVVDVTNALDGEGPMTPERSGALPVLGVLRLVESGAYDIPALRDAVQRRGGLFAHLGTNDFQTVEQRVAAGDMKAAAVVQAMIYAVAKHAASFLPVLVTANDPAPVDALVLAGGLAHSELVVKELTRLLSPLFRVEVVLGLTEALVMAQNASAALKGRTPIQEYRGESDAESCCSL